MELQGSLCKSSDIFITRLCKMLCCSHDDQRAGSFLEQRISMAAGVPIDSAEDEILILYNLIQTTSY